MSYDAKVDQYLSNHFPKIFWMDQEWYVKTTSGGAAGPGPNVFDPSSVQVDQKGVLNMSIRNSGTQWLCAEVMSKNYFHFGNYEWIVQGDVYNLDQNVVFAMFLYPPHKSVAMQGTNEIDIEFARWGNLRQENLDYTLFPASSTNIKEKAVSKSFPFHYDNSMFSSHQLVWSPTSIQMQSSHLYPHSVPKIVNSLQMLAQPGQIPQIPLRCHMNLWLFRGNAPANGQNVNLGFKGFKYTPL